MVQFYDAYSSESFSQLIHETLLKKQIEQKAENDRGQELMPIELAQISQTEFVPFQMAQIPDILFQRDGQIIRLS